MKTILIAISFATALVCSCANTQQQQQATDAVRVARDVICGDLPLAECIRRTRALMDELEQFVDAGSAE